MFQRDKTFSKIEYLVNMLIKVSEILSKKQKKLGII